MSARCPWSLSWQTADGYWDLSSPPVLRITGPIGCEVRLAASLETADRTWSADWVLRGASERERFVPGSPSSEAGPAVTDLLALFGDAAGAPRPEDFQGAHLALGVQACAGRACAGSGCRLEISCRSGPPVLETPFEDGKAGRVFRPAAPHGCPPAVVVVLGGSEGGWKGAAPVARGLARQGWTALAWAYCGESTRNLNAVPLESVDRALHHARSLREAQDTPLALVATSKGAEAALLWQTVRGPVPDLRAMVGLSPSAAGFQSPDTLRASASWTWGGRRLPFARLPLTGLVGAGLASRLRGEPLSLLESYTRAWRSAGAAAIDPARLWCPTLLIAGKRDGLWPSAAMATALSGADAVDAHLLPDGGHVLYPPWVRVPVGERPGRLRLGEGEPFRAARQRGLAWRQVQAFLAERVAFRGRSPSA